MSHEHQMNNITIEQARYFREGESTPWLAGRSPGFREEWLHLAHKLVVGFGAPRTEDFAGKRPNANIAAEAFQNESLSAGAVGSPAVFAQPLGPDHVAVVQVSDRGGAGFGAGKGANTMLGFHILAAQRTDYLRFLGDPFWLAQRFPANWTQNGNLEAISCPH